MLCNSYITINVKHPFSEFKIYFLQTRENVTICIWCLISCIFDSNLNSNTFPVVQTGMTTFDQLIFSVSTYWYISSQMEGHWQPFPVRLLNVTFWLVWQNPLGQTVSHYPKSIVWVQKHNQRPQESHLLFTEKANATHRWQIWVQKHYQRLPGVTFAFSGKSKCHS